MSISGLRRWAVAVALAALVGASAEDGGCGAPSSADSVPGCQATTVAPSWAAGFSTDGTGLQVKKHNALVRTVQGVLWAKCPVTPKAHVLELYIFARPQNSVGDLFQLAKETYTKIPGKDWTPYPVTAPFVTGDYEMRYTVFVTNADGPQPPESGKGYRKTFTINDW